MLRPVRLFQFTEHLQGPSALRERTDAPGQLGHHGDFEGRRHAPLRQREQRAGAVDRRWGGAWRVHQGRQQGWLEETAGTRLGLVSWIVRSLVGTIGFLFSWLIDASVDK